MHGVRLDGRQLREHRPVRISPSRAGQTTQDDNVTTPSSVETSTAQNDGPRRDAEDPLAKPPGVAASSSSAAKENEKELMAVVEVRLGDTYVMATATSSVFRDERWQEEEAEEKNGDGAAPHDGGSRKSEDANTASPPPPRDGPSVTTPPPPTTSTSPSFRGKGVLDITLGAVPRAIHEYTSALIGAGSGGKGLQRYEGGGANARSRYLLATLALSLRHVYGARQVRCVDTTLADGAVVAEEVLEEEEEGGGENPPEVEERRSAFSTTPLATGFPAEALYIDLGFAFHIRVALVILESAGGNLLTALSTAVYTALQRLALPHVTLQRGPRGVVAEIDPHRRYTTKPIPSLEAHLSRLVVLGISPTRQYVVDPTWEEEIALPQQLHVAVNASGQVTYARYQQWPSRRGNRRLEPQYSAKREREEGGSLRNGEESRRRGGGGLATSSPPPPQREGGEEATMTKGEEGGEDGVAGMVMSYRPVTGVGERDEAIADGSPPCGVFPVGLHDLFTAVSEAVPLIEAEHG